MAGRRTPPEVGSCQPEDKSACVSHVGAAAALLAHQGWACRCAATLPVSRRLDEAYEALVAAQGGLHAARPRELLEALQPEFPELTVQVG